MTPVLMATLMVVSFLVFLLLGLPVAFCLIGVSVMLGAIFLGPEVLYAFYSNAFSTLMVDVYIAVPLFIFMAAVLQNSGIGNALYSVMYSWFAGIRGGLAIGSVAIATLIAAMTGLAGTDVIIMGMLAYPEMRKRGYDKAIAIGCIPAGGALGPLIPPSIIMILIGGLSSLSVGRLFMGGLFPGLLMSTFFIIYIAVRCWCQPHLAPAVPLEERATWKEKIISLRGIILPIMLVLFVLGAIYSGMCTPSEAGGIGAFGALITAAIYRQLNWKNLKQATLVTLRVVSMVVWLLIGGACFSSLMTMSGVSHFICDTLAGMAVSPMVVIVAMMLLALGMGMIMDTAAITMILVPIFVLIVTDLGIPPLWFFLLFTINMIVGYISPPFGMNLFYTKGIMPPDVTMMDIWRSVIPYTFLMIGVLIVGLLYPPLLLWLPSTMIK